MHEEKLKLQADTLKKIQNDVRERGIRTLYTVACGGSLATIWPAKYILERESTKLTAGAYSANEFFYDPPARIDANTLVILNSSSGSTPETVNAARLAKERGALVVAFCANIGSALEEQAHYTLYYYENLIDPPADLAIYPEAYLLTAAVLDAVEGSARLKEMREAIGELNAISEAALIDYAPIAREFALASRNEPLVYTISAGLDRSAGYVLTNCSFMESVWIHSSPLHAGEFFHGAFEAVDEETPVVAFLGLGKVRALEERAVLFLQRITKKLTVIDARNFVLSSIPEWTRPYIAMLVLGRVAGRFCESLCDIKGHPSSSRRYMGVVKY